MLAGGKRTACDAGLVDPAFSEIRVVGPRLNDSAGAYMAFS